GKLDVLELGNLDACRDWGFARDYVDGMWRMMQVPKCDTYLLATGRSESVRHFVELAFRAAGFSLEWRGSGSEETGVDAKKGRPLIRVNPAFYRPAEVERLVGDPAKAKTELGWQPTTTLEQLCSTMVE